MLSLHIETMKDMRTNYSPRNIDETHYSDYCGKVVSRFSYEKNLLADTNPTLIRNFLRVCDWIATNCPNLNGIFNCSHDVYSWVRLVVEDGKTYLECGSHGWGWDIALSSTETAVMNPASMQKNPYAFKGNLFFKNNHLEKFLKEWSVIKQKVVDENNRQMLAFSDDFRA